MSFETSPSESPSLKTKDTTASPYEQKGDDKNQAKLIPTTLAYENRAFLRGNAGRLVRIICEFEEPGERLRQHNIKGTILFFGSARSMNKKHFDETIAGLRAERDAATDPKARAELAEKVLRFEKVEWMCPFTDVVEDLARRLTEWSMTQPKLKDFYSKQPDYLSGFVQQNSASHQPLVVCTGGGPGIMEAANKGASSVPGALSMGCGITLPFEKGLNPHVTPSLAFEYHYFFTRKFWMMLPAKGLVVGPGGMGTCDELFELLTLRQTGKLPDMPIVLLGKKFWQTVVNWQALADFGTVSQAEVDKLFFTDDATEAFNYITSTIEECAETFAAATTTPAHHHMGPKAGSGAAMPAMSLDVPHGAGGGAGGAPGHRAPPPVSPAFTLSRHE